MEERATTRTSMHALAQKFLHLHGGLSLRSAWVLMVFVFIILNAVLVSFMGAFFYRVTGGAQNDGSVPPSVVETIGREGMAKTIDAFEARVQRFESLKTDYEASPDPSR